MWEDKVKSIAEMLRKQSGIQITIGDIPQMSKEERQAWHIKKEQEEVARYKRHKAKTFLQLRSVYNEKNVLKHIFSKVEPVSEEFKQLAVKSREIAKDYSNGAHYNVIFQGAAGTGKTMLATCILNYIQKNAVKPINCLFISVSELPELAFAKYKKEEHELQARYQQLLKDLEDTDVLLLDDLGTESSMQSITSEASQTIQDTMFKIADKMQGKAVIITTNNTGSELQAIYNQKITSRLLTTNKDHILLFNDIPDYRMQHN